MLTPRSYRWTVHYAEGPPRDVYASSKAGAMRTGRRAALIVGLRGRAAKPVCVKLLYEVGSRAAERPGLFAPDETPAEFLT